MIKGSIHEDVAMINIYEPNNRVTKYAKTCRVERS